MDPALEYGHPVFDTGVPPSFFFDEDMDFLLQALFFFRRSHTPGDLALPVEFFILLHSSQKKMELPIKQKMLESRGSVAKRVNTNSRKKGKVTHLAGSSINTPHQKKAINSEGSHSISEDDETMKTDEKKIHFFLKLFFYHQDERRKN